MTEEELEQKAEEWVKDNREDNALSFEEAEKRKQAYKDGYIQGQQELMASNEVIKRGFVDILKNDNENLKQENKSLNEQAIFGRERAKKIITEFFKWYSENKDSTEAEKYADNFLSEYFEHSANVMNQYEEWYGDRK